MVIKVLCLNVTEVLTKSEVVLTIRYPTIKARREMVAVKSICTLKVQAATTMTHIEPLQTPVRKHIAVVMSESTIISISRFSKSSQVSCDAFTNPFPYAAICCECIKAHIILYNYV